MTLYYCSLEYVGDLPVPAGGFFPVPFPRAQEKYDPWNLHRFDDATITIPADGLAIVTTEIIWKAGPQTQVRDAFMLNALRVGTDRRPAIPTGNLITKAWQGRVKLGDTLSLVVTHDHAAAQGLLEARLKLTLLPEADTPPSRPFRVRYGTDPTLANITPSGPPNVGDGIPQPPITPEVR